MAEIRQFAVKISRHERDALNPKSVELCILDFALAQAFECMVFHLGGTAKIFVPSRKAWDFLILGMSNALLNKIRKGGLNE